MRVEVTAIGMAGAGQAPCHMPVGAVAPNAAQIVRIGRRHVANLVDQITIRVTLQIARGLWPVGGSGDMQTTNFQGADGGYPVRAVCAAAPFWRVNRRLIRGSAIVRLRFPPVDQSRVVRRCRSRTLQQDWFAVWTGLCLQYVRDNLQRRIKITLLSPVTVDELFASVNT
jgi:hypothetical protein